MSSKHQQELLDAPAVRGWGPNGTYFEPMALATGAPFDTFSREIPDASAFGSIRLRGAGKLES